MRNFTILFFLAISVQIYGQSFSNKQKTLITKRTATWCPLCGGWGWSMAKGIEDLNKEDAILLKAHYSGELETQVAAEITDNWNAVYQPEFFINEARQNVGSTTWESKIQEFGAAVDENSKKDANLSFDIKTGTNGNEISADVDVTFLKTVTGSYYLGMYLVEDSIVNYQASQGNNAIHNGVLRASFSGESFGGSIANNGATEGKQISQSYTLEVDGDPVNERYVKVLAIVWKKEGSSYKVENLHEVSIGLSAKTKVHVIKESDFVAISNGDDLNLAFSLNDSYKTGRIDIYQMNGLKLKSKTFHPILETNMITIPTGHLRGKFLIVSVMGDDKILGSKKIYIK